MRAWFLRSVYCKFHSLWLLVQVDVGLVLHHMLFSQLFFKHEFADVAYGLFSLWPPAPANECS